MATLAAIDIETTGLNVHTDLILEAGVVVFDETLHPTASGVVLVATHAAVGWASRTALLGEDFHDPAQSMHMRNGLVGDLLHVGYDFDAAAFSPDDADTSAAVRTIEDADAWLSDFLAAHGIEWPPVPMVGSSVRSLDAPFLNAYMPRTSEAFTHRTIDASALIELVRFSDPESLDTLLADIADSSHRTIGDCNRSLAIIRSFVERYGVGNVMAR